MKQHLILPINKSWLTVGYMSKWYKDNYKMEHYGVDVVSKDGSRYLFASGNGEVTHCGKDNVCGNVVVVVYQNCYISFNRYAPVVVRYFHLDKINVKVGQKVTIDTKLGEWGSTGQYVDGAHLHFEVDTDYNYPEWTPTLTKHSNVLKASPQGYPNTTLNPKNVMFIKRSAPERQTVERKYTSSVSKSDTEYKILTEE